MSEARNLHVDPRAANAQVIPLPQRTPLRVVADANEAAQTAPTAASPRASGFDRLSSLHEPARDTTARAAIALAVVVAIAGIVVALKLAGVVSIEADLNRDAPTVRDVREGAPSWRHGWGTVPR